MRREKPRQQSHAPLRISAFQEKVKAGEPKPIYVLCGTDPYLVDQARRAVRYHLFGKSDPGMGLTELAGADADLGEVLDLLRTPPFLAPRRLVHIREADGFVSATRAALERYLAAPSATGSLCLEVAAWNANTNLAKGAARTGYVVRCEADQPGKVPAWLQKEVRERFGKKMTFAAAQLLVEHLGVDFAALISAVEILDLYTGPCKEIGAADVDALVARGHHERVWALCDAVAERRLPRALELLDAFWAEGMSAPEIVGLLRVQLRQLVAACALNRKMSLDAAIARAGVPQFASDRVRRAVRAFSDAHLADAYQAMVAADLEAKTTQNDRLAMETLIHRLCRPEADRAAASLAPDAAE